MYYKMLANKPLYFMSTTRNIDENGKIKKFNMNRDRHWNNVHKGSFTSESAGFKGVPNHQVAGSSGIPHFTFSDHLTTFTLMGLVD